MTNINFDAYFDNALKLNEEELVLRDELLPQIPDTIVDAHSHASHQSFVEAYDMPEHIQAHMMSTFPQVDIEQSQELDSVLMPNKTMHKVRFAHVYPRFDQKAITEYIEANNTENDGVALFGLSNTPEEVQYTIAELEKGTYSALKMYYLNSEPPKTAVYEYFPPEILEVAEKQGVPIILHLPGSLYTSAHEALDVSEKYPNLKIILAHIGVANVPKPELGGILDSFSERPNIYVDTAMVDSTVIATEALRRLGPKKVLYGSDEPLNLMRVVTYFNPDIQRDRVLTDYPYHWADPTEQTKWRHLADKPFVHSHWHQLDAIIKAVRTLDTHTQDAALESVFSKNAFDIFPNLK